MTSKIRVQVTVNDKVFYANFFDSQLTAKIVSMMPLTLDFARAFEREYYSKLPQKVEKIDLKPIFEGHKNCLYFFEPFNAFSTLFEDANTAPDEIYHIGEYEEDISTFLKEQGSNITMTFAAV